MNDRLIGWVMGFDEEGKENYTLIYGTNTE